MADDRAAVPRAKRLIEEGRYETAVELLEAHLSEADQDHVARGFLAYAHYKGGNYGSAEGVYRVMVAGPSATPRDQYSLGRALERQGKIAEATHWIGAAAAADPGLTEARADYERLSRASDAAIRPANRRPADHPSPPQPPAAPSGLPATVLGVPRTEQELEAFTEPYRAQAKMAWWTEHWHAIPWGVRVFQIVFGLLILAFMVYVGVNIAIRS
jgi:tetratricopeptide (TPR) repeat protein